MSNKKLFFKTMTYDTNSTVEMFVLLGNYAKYSDNSLPILRDKQLVPSWVTMLTREEWTRGPRTPPAVKGLVWFADGSRNAEGTGAEVYGQSVNRRIIISLCKDATVFQAEVYAILACVHEIETQEWPEKYVS
jgi:hypothetical protein